MKFFALALFLPDTGAQDVLLNTILKKIYTTTKLVKIPAIVDKIFENAWNVVDWSTAFVEKKSKEGVAPTFQTKFKVMFDAKYLYSTLRAFDDAPLFIVQRLSSRDGFRRERQYFFFSG